MSALKRVQLGMSGAARSVHEKRVRRAGTTSRVRWDAETEHSVTSWEDDKIPEGRCHLHILL